MNNKCISFHFFKMENKKGRKMATDRLRGKKKKKNMMKGAETDRKFH